MVTNVHRQFSNLKENPIRAVRVYKLVGHATWVYAIVMLIVGLSASSTKPVSPRHIEVVAKRFAFDPAEITLKRGEPVDFVLSSEDVDHGVRIRELGLDLRVAKAKKAETTFTPQSIGTFVGHCSVFCGSGHGRMTLTIHVVA